MLESIGSDIGLPDLFARWFEGRGWTPRRHQLALIDLARQGQERAADRADRRRQDAGRISAVADRAHRAAAGRQGPRARQGQGRAAHALHLAAQGAGDRHPPQPRAADRRDAAAGARREPDRRHAAEPPPAPARAAARPADDHAGVAGAAAVLSRRARSSSPACAASSSTSCIPSRPPSAAITWRCASRGWRRCRRRRASSACRPPSPIRRSWPTICACATARRSRSCTASRARAPKVTIVDAQERLPWGGHMGHHAVPEVYNIIRQHKTSIVFVNTRAQAELVFDASVAHQRREPGDRPASRLAGRRAAPQGRGGDGGRQAARRGGDVVARSRHRLGRRRPGDPDGRAQGRQPPDAAHRPRQPPARRAEPRHDRAGQPLRGAGIAGGARGHRGARARRRSAAAGLPRRAGAAHRRHRLRPADRPRGLLPRGAPRPALSRPAAARTSTTPSTSSPPAAMRWRPTSAGTG